jgi:hypothetical protein
MITSFKIYETNLNQPKFKEGDRVYLIGLRSIRHQDPTEKLELCVVEKVVPGKVNYYVLDKFPNIQMREDFLMFDYEYDAKKYNL